MYCNIFITVFNRSRGCHSRVPHYKTLFSAAVDLDELLAVCSEAVRTRFFIFTFKSLFKHVLALFEERL